jgi:tRNA threonylcarbamoyladenosine biosynthesis protein TsaE
MIIKTNSPAKTKKVGYLLGKEILSQRRGMVLSLEGNLGTGKTTFLQGFAKGMGIKEKITSPTFLIFKKYEAKQKMIFYHFDAYRIKSRDLSVLGFKDITKDKNNIIAIEWSENIKDAIPKKAVKISFSFISPKERKLILKINNDIIIGSCLSAFL